MPTAGSAHGELRKRISDGGRGVRNVKGKSMNDRVRSLWPQEEGQAIAEYAVMLAVILGMPLAH